MAVDWRRRLRVSRFDPANPQASFLKPFERIVLSGSDESTTRAAYGIPASVRIFGPWVGNLGNDGERITLKDKKDTGRQTQPRVQRALSFGSGLRRLGDQVILSHDVVLEIIGNGGLELPPVSFKPRGVAGRQRLDQLEHRARGRLHRRAVVLETERRRPHRGAIEPEVLDRVAEP